MQLAEGYYRQKEIIPIQGHIANEKSSSCRELLTSQCLLSISYVQNVEFFEGMNSQELII